MSTVTPTLSSATPPTVAPGLSPARLNVMRAGYLLMGVGLAIVKWPLLPHAASMPFYAGVTLCLLTAMSLLALLGLRHPVKLLPLLLFESLWKFLWLSLVALPKAITGSLDAVTTENVINCSLIVVIIAVTPWRYVWRTLVRARGDRWR
jgi:hypothetical protein